MICFHLITAADIGEVSLPTISQLVEGGTFMVPLTLSLPAGATLECAITVTVSTAPGTAVDTGMSYHRCNCPLGISYFCPQAQIQISWA